MREYRRPCADMQSLYKFVGRMDIIRMPQKRTKKIAFLFTVRMFKSTVKRKAIVKPFDLFNYLSMFTDNYCQSYCRMEL